MIVNEDSQLKPELVQVIREEQSEKKEDPLKYSTRKYKSSRMN